jgi:hypothetical protein
MSREDPTPWRAYSWLYEVLLYHVFTSFGYPGVMWLRTLLAAGSAAAVFAFWFRRAGFCPLSVFFVAAIAIMLTPLATERPWHVTIAFTTATAGAVTAVRDGLPVRRIVWLPLLYVIWANIHIQFVLGWGVLGLGCLFPARANRAALVALTAACIVAVLVNPYHLGLFQVIWEYATQGAALKLVQELSAPDPFHDAAAAVRAIAVLVIWGWAMLQVVRRRPIDLFEIGLLVAAVVLAVRMNRDIWFVAVAAAAVMRPAAEAVNRTWLVAALVIAAFLGVRLLNATGLIRSTDYVAAQAEKYPVRAVQVIQAEGLPGPIYNDFDWGGYLIGNAPEYPVSIDGRTNLYGNERLLRSFNTWSTETGWQDDPDFHTSRIVLAQQGQVLTSVLKQQPHRWRVVYEDGIAVVFARQDATE